MPTNLQASKPVGVWPQMAYTQFESGYSYPTLSVQYHCGETERTDIVDFTTGLSGGNSIPVPLRHWKLGVKLRNYKLSGEQESPLQTLKDFIDQHQGVSFLFYDPFDADPVGGGYDPSGRYALGQYTVVLVSQGWSARTTLGRTEVTGIELKEVDYEMLVSLGS